MHFPKWASVFTSSTPSLLTMHCHVGNKASLPACLSHIFFSGLPQSPISSMLLSTGTMCTFSSARSQWSTPLLARWGTCFRPETRQTCGLWRLYFTFLSGMKSNNVTSFANHMPTRLTAVQLNSIVVALPDIVVVNSVIFPSCSHRWFSPELHVFVRMTTAVHRGCWNVTGRRSSKHGWTARSQATPSSTLMFCSRWQTCCRSTTGRPCLASSPRRQTGWNQCYCLFTITFFVCFWIKVSQEMCYYKALSDSTLNGVIISLEKVALCHCHTCFVWWQKQHIYSFLICIFRG